MADNQTEQLIQQYEAEIAAQQARQSSQQYPPTMFPMKDKQNLIEYELDFSQELIDIGRLLRCDVMMIDPDGHEYWVANPNKDLVFLNEVGVNDVLRLIKILVNKGKVLSNYKIEEINARVRMIAHEIRTLIYNQYENYGMDNEYKMNNYSMIVLAITPMIEDAYRRALGGEGHKGLADQRFVNQTEPLSGPGFGGYPQQTQNSGNKGKGHWYAPWSWGR